MKFILLLTLAMAAQAPLPARVYHTECTPLDGGPRFTLEFEPFPVETTRSTMTFVLGSTDKTPPVITGISVSGGPSVMTGQASISSGSNGAPFTVTATDDVGVRDASLYMDGKFRTATSGGDEVLPNLFYLRWNSRAVTPGVHTFKLIVWDAGGNHTEQTWTMKR